jgi:hypothetical protein
VQDQMKQVKKGLAIGSLLALSLLLPLRVTAFAAEGNHGHDNRATVTNRTYTDWDDWDWDGGWGWGSPYYSQPYGYYQSRTGKIKLEHVDGKDHVYLNGAFAGRAGDLRTIRLRPGQYTVEVRHNGKDVLNERVYVAAGATVKLKIGDNG